MNTLWVGLFLVLAGFGLIFIHLMDGTDSSSVEGGGIVMIGPFPVLFGSSSKYVLVALISGVFLLIFMYLFLFLK